MFPITKEANLNFPRALKFNQDIITYEHFIFEILILNKYRNYIFVLEMIYFNKVFLHFLMTLNLFLNITCRLVLYDELYLILF